MQPARRRTALAGILAAVFVSGTGIGSILPILPLYLRERGASYALVGGVVAAALGAQAAGALPGGAPGRPWRRPRGWPPWRWAHRRAAWPASAACRCSVCERGGEGRPSAESSS